MSLRTRLARWLAPEVVRWIETVMWTRNIIKCKYCGRPIPQDANFCIHCGDNQKERQTTGQIKLVRPILPSPPQTATSMIKAYQRPGERPIQTLARVNHWHHPNTTSQEQQRKSV